MITYKEVAFIAYPVLDIPRARKFYEGVLGLRPNAPLKSEDQAFIEYDLGPSTVAIGCHPSMWKPSHDGPCAAFEVTDFDEALATLKEHGIEPVMGPHDGPICRMVVVRDPDGNKITLHQRKEHP